MSSSSKQGFHWKTIEIKPDNWEKLHHLIKSAYCTEEQLRDKSWEKPLVLDTFLQVFPDLKSLFPDPTNPNAGGGSSTKKPKGKGGGGGGKGPGKKQEIMERVEREKIKKDMLNIRLDKNLRPLDTHFDMEISFVLMIMVWNFYMDQKNSPDMLVLLDAIISLNRIMDVEAENLGKNPILLAGMENLRMRMNNKVTEHSYALLFQNPVLLVDCTADKRKKGIKLYKEQAEILDKIAHAIIMDEPLLMGNQMPTGTGKTFLAVPLAQKISKMKRNKTVLFACSNPLVTQDIASTALLGDDIHLWMSKLIRDEDMNVQVLLRPYKRCFPAKWKQVYKEDHDNKMGSVEDQWNFYKENTGRTPDIIVCDLEACYELLQSASRINNPFIAYIDEFISDEPSNKIMAKICRFLPKQTVLLSAILPSFDRIQPIVEMFFETHPSRTVHSPVRVETTNVPITCAIVDQNGQLRMPHHEITTMDQLLALIQEININPRLRRCYTAKHVYYWAQSLQDLLSAHQLGFMDCFPDIGKIKNINVIAYAVDLLTFLSQHFELLDRFKAYRPTIMEPPNKDKVFTSQTYAYDGKTLFISKDTFGHLATATPELLEGCVRWSAIMAQTEKNEAMKQQKLKNLEKMQVDKDNSSGFNKLEKSQKMSQLDEMSTIVTLPPAYVLNSREHFNRFHPDKTNQPPAPHHRIATILPEIFNDAFDDESNVLMAGGVAAYDKQKMTSYQRNLVMTMYRKMMFLCSCKDIVFGTNLPDLVNVFISREFAMSENIPILYQLMGRVGRMGRSYHANIILDAEESVQKILSLDANVDNTDVITLVHDFAHLD